MAEATHKRNNSPTAAASQILEKRTEKALFVQKSTDTLVLILRFLGARDVARVLQTCRTFQKMECKAMWKTVWENEFSNKGYILLKSNEILKDTSNYTLETVKEHCKQCHAIESMPCGLVKPKIELVDRQNMKSSQGSSMAASEDGQRAFMLMGRTKHHGICPECWVFNADSMTWQQHARVITATNPSYGHVVTAIRLGDYDPDLYDCFVATGGCTAPEDEGITSDITTFALPRHSLDCKVETRYNGSVRFAPRAYHTAVSVLGSGCHDGRHAASNKIFLFGGFNTETSEGVIDQFQLLDVDTLQVESIMATIGQPPCARFGHSCVVLKDSPKESRLLISGGCTAVDNQNYPTDPCELKDQYVVRLSTNGAHTLEFQKVISGCSPRAIARLHSATQVGGKIFFFGGGSIGFTTNQLSILSETSTDSSCQPSFNETVLQRTMLPDGYCLVDSDFTYSGYDMNTNDEEEHGETASYYSNQSALVATPEAIGDAYPDIESDGKRWPCRRQGQCAAWLKNDKIIIYGGCTARGYRDELGDSWVLQFATLGR